MTDNTNDAECWESDCPATPTHAVRTDRLWSVVEVCDAHIGWAVKFFMKVHGCPVVPLTVAPIAFGAEAGISVPVIKAGLLDEAARRIQDEAGVEEPGKSRVIEVLRDMRREPRP
ncbi:MULTISPECIES: hypothetical protein [unclassified Streptomyces]|uniref:hypothetical protein n=1 Tax=unclassified Streptomyces TaxID=2593676 RepID=UPI000DDA47D9|nr:MULTISPECIES: hypothetical protein [unclassified Streptomyces]QZZ25536.1 hypothetical protein A7X85_03900 [Streptomyces sp. ST1015]